MIEFNSQLQIKSEFRVCCELQQLSFIANGLQQTSGLQYMCKWFSDFFIQFSPFA